MASAQKAREFLRVVKMDRQIEIVARQSRERYGDTPEKLESVNTFIRDELIEGYTDRVTALFAKTFTDEELDWLIATYSSPLFQRILDPSFMEEMAACLSPPDQSQAPHGLKH